LVAFKENTGMHKCEHCGEENFADKFVRMHRANAYGTPYFFCDMGDGRCMAFIEDPKHRHYFISMPEYKNANPNRLLTIDAKEAGGARFPYHTPAKLKTFNKEMLLYIANVVYQLEISPDTTVNDLVGRVHEVMAAEHKRYGKDTESTADTASDEN